MGPSARGRRSAAATTARPPSPDGARLPDASRGHSAGRAGIRHRWPTPGTGVGHSPPTRVSPGRGARERLHRAAGSPWVWATGGVVEHRGPDIEGCRTARTSSVWRGGCHLRVPRPRRGTCSSPRPGPTGAAVRGAPRAQSTSPRSNRPRGTFRWSWKRRTGLTDGDALKGVEVENYSARLAQRRDQPPHRSDHHRHRDQPHPKDALTPSRANVWSDGCADRPQPGLHRWPARTTGHRVATRPS
jgi:hypothetical protein